MTPATRAIGAWLLGLMLLALLGLGVTTRSQRHTSGATLVALTRFTERPLGNPWTPHAADAHAAMGLRMLADAMAETIPTSPDQAEVVRTLARGIDVAPPGTVDADMARDAFDRVGRVLSLLRVDPAAAEAVRAAAGEVNSTRPLCEQREAVVTFFVRSRDLLASVQ
jgi:hypothetical protein